jgi:hypothetical protein
MRPDKILYFIEGPLPTSEDYAAALELRANVVFRNALAVPEENSSLEPCDGVAGEVPPAYAKAYPPAEAAIAKTKSQLKALQQKMGERAPKPDTLPSEPDPEEGAVEGSRGREIGKPHPSPPKPTQLPAEPPRATAKPVDKGWAPNK